MLGLVEGKGQASVGLADWRRMELWCSGKEWTSSAVGCSFKNMWAIWEGGEEREWSVVRWWLEDEHDCVEVLLSDLMAKGCSGVLE